MKTYLLLIFIFFFAACAVISCAPSTHQVLATGESQAKLRAIQTRAFDTVDETKMLRTIIATLQDLGFIIDRADANLGTISATKLNMYNLRITVTVRPRGESQLLVRANAQSHIYPLEDPAAYQNFFNSLSKAMFLTAHEVD